MTGTETLDQLALNALIVHALEYVKAAPWFPWLTHQTDRANRAAGVVLAIAAGLGVSYSWDPSHHALLISGLDPHLLWAGARSWALQQFIYKASTTKKEPVQA